MQGYKGQAHSLGKEKEKKNGGRLKQELKINTGGKKRNAEARGKVKQECLSKLKIPEYLEGVGKLCQIL